MDQQFQELISCLGGGSAEGASPEVCKCASPVMAAPEKLVVIEQVKDIVQGGTTTFWGGSTKTYVIIAVILGIVIAIIVGIVIAGSSKSLKKIDVASISDEILGLLNPLPDDLREEAIKFYKNEFNNSLSAAEQAELKSKIMKWADSWVEYEETKKEEEMKRVRFLKEPVFQAPVVTPPLPVKQTVQFKEPEKPEEPKKKLANLYATEEVEVSHDFGRISEKSIEVEERMKRRSEQDRLMSQQVGLPFSDEFEPKK